MNDIMEYDMSQLEPFKVHDLHLRPLPEPEVGYRAFSETQKEIFRLTHALDGSIAVTYLNRNQADGQVRYREVVSAYGKDWEDAADKGYELHLIMSVQALKENAPTYKDLCDSVMAVYDSFRHMEDAGVSSEAIEETRANFRTVAEFAMHAAASLDMDPVLIHQDVSGVLDIQEHGEDGPQPRM